MFNAREIMELQKLSGMDKFSKLTVKQALDREKLIELLTAALCNQSVEEVADHLITNDVVPVVRCMYCKYYYYSSDGYKCGKGTGLIGIVRPDNFCSYGERNSNIDKTE